MTRGHVEMWCYCGLLSEAVTWPSDACVTRCHAVSRHVSRHIHHVARHAAFILILHTLGHCSVATVSTVASEMFHHCHVNREMFSGQHGRGGQHSPATTHIAATLCMAR